MGAEGTSLTDEQRVMVQKTVDAIAGKFKREVGTGRNGKVPEDAMQGQSFAVEDAFAFGLIDGVTDFSTVLRDAVAEANKNSARR
jgi:ClpP class serine protease